MTTIVLINLNKNPVTRIPDLLLEKIKNLFSHQNLICVNHPSELRASLKDCHYILGWSFPTTFIKRNKVLKEVFLFSSQVPESLLTKDITVNNITGLNSQSVCNYIINILQTIKLTREKNILLIGMGAIGTLLKSQLSSYNVKCLTRSPKNENEYSYDHYTYLLKEADVIIPTLKLNDETKKLFSNDLFFSYIKSRALIINTARGELFDEEEIISFLDKNPKAKYLTDVTVPEPYPENGKLNLHRQVSLTPHIAGFDHSTWSNIEKKMLPIISTWK